MFSYIGIWGIGLLNIAIVLFFYWHYNRTNNIGYRFNWIITLTTLIFLRIFVIVNNWSVLSNPPPMELAMQVTQDMRQQALVSIVTPVLLPFFLGLLSFYLFRIDHDITIKEVE